MRNRGSNTIDIMQVIVQCLFINRSVAVLRYRNRYDYQHEHTRAWRLLNLQTSSWPRRLTDGNSKAPPCL